MNLAALQAMQPPPVEQTYGARDVSLYALSVGFGADPLDLDALQYVYGSKPRVVPSMALVLASPGFWLQGTDAVDWRRIVLASQRFEVFKPLPAAATLRSELRISGVIDCGHERGALIEQKRELVDTASGEILAVLEHHGLARGDGGFDPEHQQPMPSLTIPERAPDATGEIATLPQAALLFDLHGTINPIHSWPPAARGAGFPRPILHGLCTMGFAHHALSRLLAALDCDRIPEMSMDFMRPVYPGDVLTVACWIDGEAVRYTLRVPQRDQTVAKGTARLVGGRP